jgi:3-methyladenine DNA glycosylase AlkC
VASQLKDQFGPGVPRAIAGMIHAVYPRFRGEDFIRDVLKSYEPLSLTARAARIADAMHTHLPTDFSRAVDILLASASQPHDHRAANGMTAFLYMPHLLFVAKHGLDHFEDSMRAQHALTQLFTAEFSIRAFLERHPDKTLERLHLWTADPSHHVRRLVSEGTRPRLPWAPRLRTFQRDPRPVVELLEKLKDDPELYVRRSVANNLNDIGKDHPELLTRVARRWLRGASAERRWIVSHALRSAVKRAEAGALAVLGYGEKAAVTLRGVDIAPASPRIGGHVDVAFEIVNRSRRIQRVLVDLVVHFVKARGTGPKTFKLRAVELAPGARAEFAKRIGLGQLTTRKHHAGVHRVEALLNGARVRLGEFRLRPAL